MKTSTAIGLVALLALPAISEPPGGSVTPPPPAGGAVSADIPAMNTAPGKPNAQGYFYIYTEKGSKDNHYIPSGWMGDYGDLRIDDASKESPKSGAQALKITYSGKATQGANWAGIFWQQPANNWGNKPGGYDLSKYKRLTFWARGAKGNEKVAEFKVGGITGENGDSDSSSIGPVSLTQKWQKYTIDLTNKNLSHIVGGFAWAASRDDNPEGFVIYLDDIRFES